MCPFQGCSFTTKREGSLCRCMVSQAFVFSSLDDTKLGTLSHLLVSRDHQVYLKRHQACAMCASFVMRSHSMSDESSSYLNTLMGVLDLLVEGMSGKYGSLGLIRTCKQHSSLCPKLVVNTNANLSGGGNVLYEDL